MPDLATRTQREREAAAAVLLVLQRHGQAAVRLWPQPYDWLAMQTELREALADPLSRTFSEAAEQLSRRGIVIHEAEIRRWARQWATGYAGPLAATITETTREQFEAVNDGDQAAKSALAAILVGQAIRAETVGVTETTRAISAGEGWTAEITGMAGMVIEPVWITALDERVCVVCGPLHGAGPEIYNQVSPGGPPAHPNCRCILEWETQ